MNNDFNPETATDALNLVAEWLIAAYGQRLKAVSLYLEGHYGPPHECHSITVFTLDRGAGVDGIPETQESLQRTDVCAQAERLFLHLCPHFQFDHDNVRDIRDVARTRRVEAADVSAHRRIALLRRFGTLASGTEGGSACNQE